MVPEAFLAEADRVVADFPVAVVGAFRVVAEVDFQVVVVAVAGKKQVRAVEASLAGREADFPEVVGRGPVGRWAASDPEAGFWP